MVTIRRETHIDAPTERVFDLARSVDLQREMSAPDRPIAGTVAGLATPGESTVWELRPFGRRFELTTKVTAYSRPTHFRRTMRSGPLDRFVHDQFSAFEDADDPDGETVLRDVLTVELPFGPVGDLFEPVVERRLGARLDERNDRLRRVAENDEWARYVED
jgi:ligand-binding SRPBCC domain-containing protein